jgi:hypothetical protein
MRRFAPAAAALLLLAAAQPAAAQRLREQIAQLFIFGSGQDPLFLAGTADPSNPSTVQVHGNHFVPAAAAGNGTLISFITNAVSSNVANVPFSAASGGTTFRFEGGVPVRTTTSSGPIFAERAQTLGRGRILAGVNRTQFAFRTLRGMDLDNLQLVFTHANVDSPACDSVVGEDCAPMGVPVLENDVMLFDLGLEIELAVTSFFLTLGLSDRFDVGVSLPLVRTRLRGTSRAEIVPFGGPTAAHFFAGTPSNPVLSASRFVEGSATGVGDVAIRAKWLARQRENVAVALLADGRLPTGSEDDLLGSGFVALRGMAIVSARYGAFAPHVNVGYLWRDSDIQTDAVLATIGFDHLLAPWATLALDVVSELQVGDSPLRVPQPVSIERPFRRTVRPTAVPDIRDDVVNGSAGVKLTGPGGLTVLLNGMWPLNRGGLRPSVLWTFGLEHNF